MRVGKNFGGGGEVRWCGRGDDFPGEKVYDLTAVKVGDAEFLALFDSKDVAMAGLYGCACWLLGR